MHEYITAGFALCILIISVVALDHGNPKGEFFVYTVDGCVIESREKQDVLSDKKLYTYIHEKNVPWWERETQGKKRSCTVHKVVFGGLL